MQQCTPLLRKIMGWISNFEALYDSWAGIDLRKESTQAAADHEKELADLNRKQLYEKGETANGKKLKKYKNPKYARVKHQMNPLPGLGNPDFRLTGEFQESVFSDVRVDGKIIFDASDPKVEFLVERDGESIFGLQPENEKTAWADILKPPVVLKIAQLTGAKLK
ncbi:hypothetical protein JST56_07255 [Candidatus Dependentiae bacterium]|nr:hypothetical protein [Candidatus Dependentiae bacterium]